MWDGDASFMPEKCHRKNLTTALMYESLKMPFKQGKKVFKGFEFLAWKKSGAFNPSYLEI